MKIKIILASASKARSKILSKCGIPHKIAISNIKEIMDAKKGPKYNAITNAYQKAQDVSKDFKDGFVIGADTLVLLGKRLIGKPKNKLEARNLLKKFSGRTIFVFTGLCVKDIKKNKILKAVDISKIKVKKLNTNELNRFLKLVGPYNKAGGFSIEGVGSFIFDNIEGSFYNILGLPTIKLNQLFKKLGVNLLECI